MDLYSFPDMNPESLNGGSGLLGRPSPPSTPLGLTSPTLNSKGSNFPILSETDEPILSSHSGKNCFLS